MKNITEYISESVFIESAVDIDKEFKKAYDKIHKVLDKMNMPDDEKESALMTISSLPAAEINSMSEAEIEDYLAVAAM